MVKQRTLRRAKLNSELEELNKILEKKEKLANQMVANDSKMDTMKQQYEVGETGQSDDRVKLKLANQMAFM